MTDHERAAHARRELTENHQDVEGWGTKCQVHGTHPKAHGITCLQELLLLFQSGPSLGD